jgi:hypothetical protein
MAHTCQLVNTPPVVLQETGERGLSLLRHDAVPDARNLLTPAQTDRQGGYPPVRQTH